MAAFFAAMIGDGHTLPAANQLSVSATQKSGSECVAMACVSVIIMSPSVVNFCPVLFRWSIKTELSADAVSDWGTWGALSLVSGVSKLISVNVGVNWSIASGVMSSDAVMSKSGGTGNVSTGASVLSDVGTGVVCTVVLNADVWTRPKLLRARMYAVRNSAGMSGDRSDGVSVGKDGVSDSGAGAGVAGTAGAAGAGRRNAGIFIFGNGIVISGFLLRTISVVVAMYSGNAANSSRPNTKPAKPRSWAWASLCHWAMFNMSKLNRKYNIAHIANR